LPNANVAFKTNTSETTAPVLAATKLVLKTVNRLLGGSRCWLLAVSNLAQTREPGSKSKLVVCAGQTIGLNERLGSDLRNILECVRGATKQQMGCHGDWQAFIYADCTPPPPPPPFKCNCQHDTRAHRSAHMWSSLTKKKNVLAFPTVYLHERVTILLKEINSPFH